MLRAQPLTSARLELEPLRVDHASEMAQLLDDRQLHTFIGGEPATMEQLRARYERQVVGRSSDGAETWLNWVLRRADTGKVVGTTQATVTTEGAAVVAKVAWVIGTPHQGRRYARESAQVMVNWLRLHGITMVVAHVHPRHGASMSVARAVGLAPTGVVVDGEVRWQDVRMGDLSFPDPSAEIAPLLVVSDLARSLQFYVEQLGATAITTWDTYAQLRLGTGRLHLATPSPGSDDKPGISLVAPAERTQLTGEVVLHVRDCRQVHASLAARGLTFLAPPSEPDWGGEIRCFLQDPDGHVIELSQTRP